MSLFEQFFSDINKNFMYDMVSKIFLKDHNINITEDENNRLILSNKMDKIFKDNNLDDISTINKVLLDEMLNDMKQKYIKEEINNDYEKSLEKLIKERDQPIIEKSEDAENKEKDALEFYGRNLGLTFQIADDTLDYNAELKLFGKKIGQDFFEGKITLPIILLFQKLGNNEKKILSNMFKKELRTKDDFNEIIALINKYKIIQECYQKAQHYINLASNSLSVFKDSEEKNILKRLTSFSLSRNF